MQTTLRKVAVLWIAATASVASAQEVFPRPPEITDAVAFWTRVYTEVSSNGGFLHDPENLAVVYEKLDFGDQDSSRQRQRLRDRAAENYRTILRKLGQEDRGSLSGEEARVLALWPAGTSRAEFRRAAEDIRFQLGQADRFRAGLVRSGRWRAHIDEVLAEVGVPPELAVLPHVESSYDPTAYSRVGAAGMWQFTRSTGVRYMRIDHIVDQRRDPYMSTEAAARLLKDNFDVLGTWPLAITAYNHGQAGMRRAVEVEGTNNIGEIIKDYDGRLFGFASRNFYPAFLAALDVDRSAERYFPGVTRDAFVETTVIVLPDFVDAAPLANSLDLPLDELRSFNPALTDTVWAGDKYIPRGFEVRMPGSGREPAALIAAIPANARFAAQRPDLTHRVVSGDTLSEIADQYGISLSALIRANSLDNNNMIRIGQQLNLPVTGREVVAAAAPRPAAVEPVAEPPPRAEPPAEPAAEPPAEPRVEPRAEPPVEAPAVQVAAAETGESPVDPPPPTPAQPSATAVAEVREASETDIVADSLAEPETNLLASTQATLAADPSDYSVADDETIEVQDMETLGHYADWLGLRTQRLRDINALPFVQAVVVGQRIRLDFSQVDRELFETRRVAYQTERQESFFEAYQIEEVVEHVVRSGESLWLLASREYEVPVWLLRQYNPDVNLDRVRPGTVIRFPRLKSIQGDAA
jgi:membrane-bound lytic murein transglycosylase D